MLNIGQDDLDSSTIFPALRVLHEYGRTNELEKIVQYLRRRWYYSVEATYLAFEAAKSIADRYPNDRTKESMAQLIALYNVHIKGHLSEPAAEKAISRALGLNQ